MFQARLLAATALTIGLALSSGVSQARQDPLIEQERVMVTRANGDELTTEQMRGAILAGGRQLGWVEAEDKPGQITLRFDKGSRQAATIAVDYDAKGHKIRCVSSVNRSYKVLDGVPQIYPSYIRWIRNLNQSMGRAAAF